MGRNETHGRDPFSSADSSLLFAAYSGGPDTVWRLGAFDRSSAEFADGSPDRPVVFVVDQSLAGRDWYANAPAFFPSRKPDPASAPRAIQFSLGSKPTDAYRLRVSLLIEHSSVPALQVAINGHAGVFYLHPKLDYSMGDTMAAFFPAYSHATVEVDFPGSYLHAGANTITLQAVATEDKGVPDAGFVYDAVELDRHSTFCCRPHLRLWRRPFFIRNRDRCFLNRWTSSSVTAGIRAPERVDLAMAGKHYRHPLRGGSDFGEERVSLEVPRIPAQIRLPN